MRNWSFSKGLLPAILLKYLMKKTVISADIIKVIISFFKTASKEFSYNNTVTTTFYSLMLIVKGIRVKFDVVLSEPSSNDMSKRP